MIITVTVNPAVDKTLAVSNFSTGTLNRIESITAEAGGKGVNVAKALTSLGASCVAMGFLGGDSGDFIERALADLGVLCDFVRVESPTRTNIKVQDVLTGITTELNEAGASVSGSALEALEKQLFDRAKPGDIVVLSGSIPPRMSPDIYGRWIEKLRARAVDVILDADGEAFRRGALAGPTAVKPNLRELETWSRRPIHLTKEVCVEARRLLEYEITRVLVSMGDRGAILVGSDGIYHSPCLPVRVGGTVGAGDAMTAALAVSLQRGASPENTLRLATAAATATVMAGRMGIFDPESIRALLLKVQTEVLE